MSLGGGKGNAFERRLGKNRDTNTNSNVAELGLFVWVLLMTSANAHNHHHCHHHHRRGGLSGKVTLVICLGQIFSNSNSKYAQWRQATVLWAEWVSCLSWWGKSLNSARKVNSFGLSLLVSQANRKQKESGEEEAE